MHTPYSSCERNRPIFTRLCCSILSLSGGAMVFVYGWAFSAHALPNVACEFNAMHINVRALYNHGINNQSLQNHITAATTAVTTDPQAINQYNYVTGLTAIESTLTDLQNTINITAAPIFTPNNTKFFCYIANKPLGFMIETLLQNKITLLQTATKKIQHISHYLQQIEHQQHSSIYPVSTATAQSAIKQQDAVLSFVNGDFKSIATQFSQAVNENTHWVFWGVGLAILPLSVCLCGCCGLGMILCGGADDSESLEDWDKEVGMFKHSRRVLRLTGCVAKTGAKINGSAIYCSFFVSAIYLLTGGFAFVLNGVGNDLCTSLPTLMADLPLYVPTASPADNNRLSNERIQNSLLPICLSASGTNINTTIVSSVFNLSTIQYQTLVNLTAYPTAWSSIKDAIQDVRSDVAAMHQHSNTNCFLESSASTYEKITTDAKSFVHYNSSSSTYGNAYRHQTTYIEGVLQEMAVHLNMSAMGIALQQLENIVKSTSRVERHLNQLQQGYNVTALLHYCRAVQESTHRFQHSACENTMPLLFLIGASLFFSGVVGVLVGFDTLCLQNRWGGHGPIPLSTAQPSLQHRQSTIEMKQNPMGEGGARSDNVVFDLHGEMKPTSWM